MIFTACNSVETIRTKVNSTSTLATVSATLQSGLAATTTEAADDLVWVPAGVQTYRANINPPNQWGVIRTVDVEWGSGSDIVGVSYRDYIETPSGQTRNNIIDIGQENSQGVNQVISGVVLNVIGLPPGITVNMDSGGYDSSFSHEWIQIMHISISPDIKPGYYEFNIDVQIGREDYGTMPCIIKVS